MALPNLKKFADRRYLLNVDSARFKIHFNEYLQSIELIFWIANI